MTVRVERTGDAVVATIDRLETRNALDEPTVLALGRAVREASADASVRGVVLTGAGSDVFTSGGDLKAFAELSLDAAGAEAVLGMLEPLRAIGESEVPVIAAVQGDVFGGGCELALLCDILIAEEHAGFAFRHARMGLSPAWGGLTRLLERAGPLETARVLFTAERIDASEAQRIGLVNQVVPRGGSRAAALRMVERIAESPRRAVAALKQTLEDVRRARASEGLAIERAAFVERWGSPEHRAAMATFAAKNRG